MLNRMTFVFAAFLLVTSPAFAAKKKASLYERLGEKKGITAVVDDFVGRCAADPRIKDFFKDTAADPGRLTAFKAKLVDQICQAAGGPCTYTGKDMDTAHPKEMGVKNEHFDALVDDLSKSLDKFKVKKADKKALLAVLGPMRKDIVKDEHHGHAH